MDEMRERVRQNWVMLAIALGLGIVVGVFYAWVIDPADFVNATPDLLREDLRVDYLRMAIDSYSINRNVDKAIDRFEGLGEFGAETLELVGADPEEVDPTAIQNFSAVVEIMEAPGEEAETGEQGEQPAATEPAQESRPAGFAAARLILPVCAATFVLGLLLVGALVLRNRLSRDVEEEPILEPGFDMPEEFAEDFDDEFGQAYEEPLAEQFEEPGPMAGPADETIAAEPSGPEPLATFRTVYTLGEDRYDDSFSIESPAGDFLGECGVGIGEVMGAGEPKKVSAFEVWLFDKNDIQTVTQVLMSKYAYQDEETRARVAAKGEPVLAEPGGVLYLETASLSVEARIVDLTYGQSALPAESFFERMTVELKAMPRS